MTETTLVKQVLTKDFGIVNEDQQIVEGIVTDDLVDVDGHVIDQNGFRSALVDYLQWGNIRDQHGLPVGKVLEITDWNKFVVQIVDDAVWKKIKAGLYKGFSIGIRVLGYEVEDVSKYTNDSYRGVPPLIVEAIKAGGLIIRITKMVLAEVSIVDRPANPRALITATKNMKIETEEYLPVSHFVIEAQKQYEGDTEMAKKAQTAVVEDLEKSVDAVDQVTDTTEVVETENLAVEDTAVAENDLETKFASLEGIVSDLVTRQDNLSKQLTDISQVLMTVSKALEAQAEAVDEVVESVVEPVVEAVSEKSINTNDMDAIVAKLRESFDEAIEKAASAAVAKMTKTTEVVERSGGVNLGDGAEVKKETTTSTSKTDIKQKATYGNAATLLANIISRQSAPAN